MDDPKSSTAQQIARAAVAFVYQRTGAAPGSVDVAQRDETLLITLHHTLAPVACAQARNPGAALKQQDLYRELFANSSGWLCREISRITDSQVLAITGAVEAATGTVEVALVTGRAPGAADQPVL